MSTSITCPVVMRLAAVAAFMDLQPRSILNSLRHGTFLPLPFASHPYRWRGEDIEKWYRGEFKDALETLRRDRRRRKAA
jgi:hypothetical protein